MKDNINIEEIRKDLFEMQDLGYRDFHSKLMPTVDKNKVIGIRTPMLRAYAKTFAKREDWKKYLQCLPHEYYEENNLHGFLIGTIKDFDECLVEVKRFLPYIDNWATCDITPPKTLKKNLPALFEEIKEWIKSEETYTIRYGVGLLMAFYLDDAFAPEHLELVGSVISEEYYVNMMIAWYFATALAKQWEATVPWIEEKRLPDWVHTKTIQKAVESYRITPKQKEYLKSFRLTRKKK